MAANKRKHDGSWLDVFSGLGFDFGEATGWILLVVAVVAIVATVIWLFRRRRRDRIRSLMDRGLCPKCEYDLRASPRRCPECGRPVPRHIQVQRRRQLTLPA